MHSRRNELTVNQLSVKLRVVYKPGPDYSLIFNL